MNVMYAACLSLNDEGYSNLTIILPLFLISAQFHGVCIKENIDKRAYPQAKTENGVMLFSKSVDRI